MTNDNEQALRNDTPVQNKRPRKVRQFFTMEDWDDERVARKFIRSSFDDIRQRLKDEGMKTQFRKPRHDDGTQSYAIFYGREEVVKKNDGSTETKIVYSDNDYLAIHFDPSRKFPGGRRRKKQDGDGDGSKHKNKSGKFNRKMKQERD